MPHSALRFRSTQPTQAQSRTTDVLPATTRRVSGNTRFLLWLVLIFCIPFLVNGLVLPAITSVVEHICYGDNLIASYDLSGKHFLTEETNGRMRIVVSNEDGSHNQVLVTTVSGAPRHALVTLSQDGNKLDVAVNGAYIAVLVPDGKGGYAWGSN